MTESVATGEQALAERMKLYKLKEDIREAAEETAAAVRSMSGGYYDDPVGGAGTSWSFDVHDLSILAEKCEGLEHGVKLLAKGDPGVDKVVRAWSKLRQDARHDSRVPVANGLLAAAVFYTSALAWLNLAAVVVEMPLTQPAASPS